MVRISNNINKLLSKIINTQILPQVILSKALFVRFLFVCLFVCFPGYRNFMDLLFFVFMNTKLNILLMLTTPDDSSKLKLVSYHSV